MRPLPSRERSGLGAFTLLEILVAVSVLTMICAMLMQIMGSTTKVTGNARQISDCETEARYAFDQITADLNSRIRRSDVDAFVGKTSNGRDTLYFFSETPGTSSLTSTARSTASLVGYRLKQAGSVWQLQRYSRQLPWVTDTSSDPSNKSLPFVIGSGTVTSGTYTFTATATSTLWGTSGDGSDGTFPRVIGANSAEDAYYQPVAQNILRMQINLLRKPDSQNPTARFLVNSELQKELSSNGLTNISAIVVTLAVIDSQSLAKLSSTDLDALTLDYTVPTSSPLLMPLDLWSTAFYTNISTLKKPLATGVKFYQRVIQL